ncbi:MAG: biopolymer transporter ExbD [Kiritimatiellae bacterium]|jgi:biopolymer transport protein ExbD|nr:biopolymer transporter ExbD [Kiritimatiellia bacterium]
MRLNMDDGNDVMVDMGPLIDCVFLLLIFFLVSTTMKKPEYEMPVELPEPAISAVPDVDRQVTLITIDNTGSFYMDGLPIGQSELQRRLKDFAEISPDLHIRIDVDRDAPSRNLVQVLDLCAFEGLKNYGIHTKSRALDRLK